MSTVLRCSKDRSPAYRKMQLHHVYIPDLHLVLREELRLTNQYSVLPRPSPPIWGARLSCGDDEIPSYDFADFGSHCATVAYPCYVVFFCAILSWGSSPRQVAMSAHAATGQREPQPVFDLNIPNIYILGTRNENVHVVSSTLWYPHPLLPQPTTFGWTSRTLPVTS